VATLDLNLATQDLFLQPWAGYARSSHGTIDLRRRGFEGGGALVGRGEVQSVEGFVAHPFEGLGHASSDHGRPTADHEQRVEAVWPRCSGSESRDRTRSFTKL
jgi:hypothetical protein